jgi:uncharacterized protein YjbI with pentapeptide repeats
VLIAEVDLATPVVAGIAVFIVAAAFAIWLIPGRQARKWSDLGVSGKDLVELETSARGTLVQLLGGVALILTFIATWMQIADTRDATSRTLRLTSEQQQTERFTRAVGQLASVRLEVRIGGIYGLDGVAAASAERRPAIAQILLAYLRQHYQGVARLREFAKRERFDAANLELECGVPRSVIVADDMQAALGVITARAAAARAHYTLAKLDLRYFSGRAADLRQADLTGSFLTAGDLRSARFDRAIAADANFARTCLSSSSFAGARVDGAEFAGADLNEVDLSKASGRGASFSWAQLRGANLRQADLYSAEFIVTDMRGADLRRADLRVANLLNANLSRADLRGADLRGADLRGTALREHTPLLAGARTDRCTRLPWRARTPTRQDCNRLAAGQVLQPG